MVFTLCILMAGCAKNEMEADADSYGLEAEEISGESQTEPIEQDMEAQENAETGEESEEEAEDMSDNPANDGGDNTVGASDAALSEQNAADTQPVVKSEKENSAGSQASAQPQVQEQSQSQVQSAPTATIFGSIKSVGSGSFTIARAAVNNDVMVSTDEDEIISIIYTDNTEFELCHSSNSGMTVNYTGGTSDDLSNGRMTEVAGAYEGAEFIAQKITITIFE